MADNGSGNNNHSTSAPSSKQGSNNAAANEIVRTFEALVRKSSRLFGSLRDLPQFGKFWSNHFQKTFEVYTKLWKYQQQYRNFLEDKEKYGLKRWEIGEIASKIGQLYYHYYLRTSDTNYLHESYIFYEALRTRAYFKDAMDSKIPDLMVKVMRFYARFIVVCLLLNRKRVVLELVDELSKHVDEYIKSLKPTDAQEWYLVLQEITTFLQADILVNANLQSSTQLSILPPRLEPSLMRNIVHSITSSSANLTATNLSSNIPNITLQQAVLVGNHSHQIKFSELTLEMFRMMLALEFDPDWKEGSETERDKSEEGAPNSKRRNPHKYLLYRPTSAQLLMFIATAVKELHDGRALMVYISADGNVVTQADGGIQRGLLMNTSRPPSSGSGVRVSAASNSNTNISSSSTDVMYMIDFLPFTRRPLFMVIDSDASSIFKEMPNTFSQPLVCLLSPSAFPFPVSTTPRGVQKGNVFTLFLSDPISAFCVVTNIDKIQQQTLEECTRTLQSTLEVICRAILSTSTVDISFLSFMNDDFLRMFILRFVFCLATLSNHKQYSNSPSHIPTSRPDMAKEVLQNPQILTGVAKVAALLGVSDQFNLTS